MKRNIAVQTLSSVMLLAVQAGQAQSEPALRLDSPAADTPNRFGLSYRMGFNLSVDFKNLGGFVAPRRLTPSGDPYNYDDGYLYNDINGGAFGSTWYWGYDAKPGQYTLGDTYVQMHRSTAQANAESNGRENDPQSGVELSYSRELQHGERVSWGLEGAFNFMEVSVDDSRTLREDLQVTTDGYAVPKDPTTGYGTTFFTPTYPGPYTHDFTSPGPLLSNVRVPLGSQTVAGGAVITGSRELEANLYGFRLGPYLSVPLSRKVALRLGGGFALAYVESDFSFNETVSVAGVGTVTHAGSSSSSGWRPGGYVAADASVALSQSWSAFAGAQFQSLGRYHHEVSGKEAVLDLSKSVFVTLGVAYSF